MDTTETRHATSEEAELQHSHGRLSPFGHLFRFFGWCFGFTGLYSMFTVCPFCGQQACPVGLVSAGTLGAFFALCVQDWKRLVVFLKHRRSQQKNEKAGSDKTVERERTAIGGFSESPPVSGPGK